jgi:MraZ protein
MRSQPGDTTVNPEVPPEKPAAEFDSFFVDFHDLLIDKHRMLLPSEFRKCIKPERDGKGFFIFVGPNGTPWFYTERRFTELARELRSNKIPGQTAVDFKHIMFGKATHQEWDKQWRVPIPERIRVEASIGTEVTLVGAEDHLEMWNRKEWTVHNAALNGKRADIFQKIEELQSPTGPR